MKIRYLFTFLDVLFLTTILACGLSSLTQSPTATVPTEDSAGATSDPVIEIPTNIVVKPTEGNPIPGVLSEADALQIVSTSFDAYPWRVTETYQTKDTGETSTSLTEAQSSTRTYTRSVQSVGTALATIEFIVIDSRFYLKIVGGGLAESYGLVEGQWTEVPPGSSLAMMASSASVDPSKTADSFGTEFAALKGESNMDELTFTLVGAEDVNGVATNVYESTGGTFVYRWWVGADGRLYKMTLDVPAATRSHLLEYDSSINVQPPIP